AFFGKPTDVLDVIAVTGTNGKTSSAWWIAQASAQLGKRCGVVGTLGVGEPPALVYNGLTTPDPVLLQAAFGRMRGEGFA
ncbi:Mur ligase family protein, partial [Klebsiella pneumoniae]|uniref:Mur ligase family protein n=1 Tax=Klebsiella pneumoniae TaxID=573 RepID=UPI00222F01C4